MNTLDRHNLDKLQKLEARKRELLSELLDIESYMEVLKPITGGAVIYIGCHTEERNEHGYPKFKAEVLLKTDDYGKATKVLRILKNTAEGLLDKGGLLKNMMKEGVIPWKH